MGVGIGIASRCLRLGSDSLNPGVSTSTEIVKSTISWSCSRGQMAANTWDKAISEWDQHCDEPVAAIRQRKDAERVEDGRQIWDGREQPVEVALVDEGG